MLIVPVFERQAAGVYRNSAAIVDADGTMLGVYRKMHIPDDPLFYEKYYFVRRLERVAHRRAKGVSGFRVWNTKYAKIVCSLLGSVVSRSRSHYGAPRRRNNLLSTAMAGLGRKGGVWPVTAGSVANRPAGTCNCERRFVASPTAWDMRTKREPTASSFLVIPSSPTHSGGNSPRPEQTGGARCGLRPQSDRRDARNWPFLRDRRVDATAHPQQISGLSGRRSTLLPGAGAGPCPQSGEARCYLDRMASP